MKAVFCNILENTETGCVDALPWTANAIRTSPMKKNEKFLIEL